MNRHKGKKKSGSMTREKRGTDETGKKVEGKNGEEGREERSSSDWYKKNCRKNRKMVE